MRGGLLIKEARLRAGLTQAALAARVGRAQPVIARWERGVNEPGLTSVVETIAACGYDLDVRLEARDDADEQLIAYHLAMSPPRRVDTLRRMLEFERLAHTATTAGD